jgi:DnaJ-class molecular chaperone
MSACKKIRSLSFEQKQNEIATFVAMATNECFYALLGVPKTATSDAIKKAYRTAARNTHPDRCGSGSTERFQAVQQAYEVLSDARLRAIYDQVGRDAALRAASMQSDSGGARSDNPFHDVEEMLNGMFGGQGGAQGAFFTPFCGAGGMFFRQHSSSQKPRQVIKQVTLEDIFEARRIDVVIPVPSQNAKDAQESEQTIQIECGSLDGFGGFQGERHVMLQDKYGIVMVRLQLSRHAEWEPAGDLRLQKTVSLTLLEALLGESTVRFTLPNAQKTVIEHRLDSVTKPNAIHVHRHGQWQFLLRFQVQFPDAVPTDEKVRAALRNALQT